MKQTVFTLALILTAFTVTAQDFGFGFDDGAADEGFGAAGSSPLSASVGGEVSFSVLGFFDEFADGPDATHLDGIIGGALNFSAAGSNAEAFIGLKLKPVFDPAISIDNLPLTVDEAYARAYFGSFDLEAGLRRLTWGKADSMGPLDVINPLDISDMTSLTDTGSLKASRPLVHAGYIIGDFTRVEAVFVPGYIPITPPGGRWMPKAMQTMENMTVVSSDPSTFDYSQAGLRFTTTLGPADLGVQYYYGRLSTPAMTISPPDIVYIDYNPYHQVGADYAQVIAGFNIRTELAANITEDLSGDDGAVYNPAIAWSLGFDRTLFWDISLNIQGTGSVRLLDDKIGSSPMQDIEAGTDLTSTRIISSLSRTFLRGDFEAGVNVIWGIEDKDFVVLPTLKWTKGDVSIDCMVGIFGGDEDGQFGQYHDNSFLKVGLTYTF